MCIRDRFGEVLRKGEVDAIAGDDPLIYTLREDNKLREIATNIEGDYENRTCCVLGLRGDLAVSYTHLDVYKRQLPVAGRAARALLARCWPGCRSGPGAPGSAA